MTSRCPYIYSTSGARFSSDEVFVEVVSDGATHVKRLGGHDDEHFISFSSVGKVSVSRFYVVCGESEVSIQIDLEACRGRRGRANFDHKFLEEIKAEYGEEICSHLVSRLIDNLPSGTKDEDVGESRGWARAAAVGYSSYVAGGLFQVIRDHSHVSKLFDRKLPPLGVAGEENPVIGAARKYEDLSNACSLKQDLSLSSWISAAAGGGALGNYAVFARGAEMPEEFLESVVTDGDDNFLKVRALRALADLNAERAAKIAEAIVIDAVRTGVGDDRLVESAVGYVNKILSAKVALNSNLPWKWSCAAVSTSGSDLQDVIAEVAADRRAHPLVRLAATARLKDVGTLTELAGDSDTRVAERACRSLGIETGKRAEATLRTRPVLEGDTSTIELAAIDLDGTLLDDTGGVVRRNSEGVRRFVDSGRSVCFTTTRTLEDAIYLCRDVLDGRNGVLVCDEGNTICDIKTGLPLRSESMIPGMKEPFSSGIAGAIEGARVLAAGDYAGVEVHKGEKGDVGLRLGLDKGATLDFVASACGVSLSKCMVIGDGRVDTPMFEKVTNAGGVSVAVANAQPGVINHPCVGVVVAASEDGGVEYALDMVLTGERPPTMSDVGLGIAERHRREVYSHYAVTDGDQLRSDMQSRGIGHLVEGGYGVRHHGGTPATPGHVTFAHPNDWRGKNMPQIADSDVWVVGWVDDSSVSALVCAVGGPEENLTKRPDGSVYHITLRTFAGLPPVVTNHVLRDGWERLATPFKITTLALESSKMRR